MRSRRGPGRPSRPPRSSPWRSPLPTRRRAGTRRLRPLPLDAGRLRQGAQAAPACARRRPGDAQDPLLAGHPGSAARGDGARSARLRHGRGRRPLRRRLRRHPRPVRGVRRGACARHTDFRSDHRRARRSGRPWPACVRWRRSCTSTSRPWRWIRSPTRAPRTATCSAARPSSRWSSAPRAAPAAASPPITPRASKRSGPTSRASTSSCPAHPTTPRACSRPPSAMTTR